MAKAHATSITISATTAVAVLADHRTARRLVRELGGNLTASLRGNDRVRCETDGGPATAWIYLGAWPFSALRSFASGTALTDVLGCVPADSPPETTVTGVRRRNDSVRKDHFIGYPMPVINSSPSSPQTREWLAPGGAAQRS